MAKAYEEKIKGLFANEEFVAKFKAIEDVEKMDSLFKEYGAELTEEELMDFIKAPVEAKRAGGELSADDLDSVNGGVAAFLATKVLPAVWGWSVSEWGSPERAVERTATFWAKAIAGDKDVWRGNW